MIVAGYIAALVMGLTLGMIGGGGSILTVPLLVYLFGVDPVTATAYSLFIVGLTALAGGFRSFLKNDVDVKTGFIFAGPSFIGVYLTRAYIVPSLPDVIWESPSYMVTKPILMMLVFAILMIIASLSMIRSRNEVQDREKANLSPVLKMMMIALEGLIVGGITGFVGAGGGFLIIPALVILVGLPMKKAVGTSLFIIAIKSLFGFIGDLQGDLIIDWNLLLTVSFMSFIGLAVGMWLVQFIPEKSLKKGFGYFVLIMGSLILWDQF